MKVPSPIRTLIAIFISVGIVLATASAAFGADPPTTTTEPTNGSSTTTVSSSGYHPTPAIVIFGLSVLVAALCLWFIYAYHRRLLNSIDKAIANGQTVASSNGSVGVQTLAVATDSGIAITGSAETQVGVACKFTSTGVPDGQTVSWTVEGDAGADPTTGSTPEFTTTFGKPGTATITIAVEGQPEVQPLTVEVRAAATTPAAPGIVLPFVVRNWGRLVVVVFGAGLIGALMVLNAISGEGGIGILGALFGVGAATSTATAPAQGQAGQAQAGQGATDE